MHLGVALCKRTRIHDEDKKFRQLNNMDAANNAN